MNIDKLILAGGYNATLAGFGSLMNIDKLIHGVGIIGQTRVLAL